MDALEYKSFAAFGIGKASASILDEAEGIVEAWPSVTNVVDSGDDLIEPGAYTDTLKARPARRLRMLDNHDWGRLTGRIIEAEELGPGDRRLPDKIKAVGGGAVRVLAQFNLLKTVGRDAFADVLFFGEDQEWSIGYNTRPPTGRTTRSKDGVRRIKSLNWFEASTVPVGMNQYTLTTAAKSATGLRVPAHYRAIRFQKGA